MRPRPLMCDSVRMVKEYLTTIAIMSILCDSARMCDSARSCATSPPGGRVRLGSLMESMGRMQNIIKRGLMLIAVAGLVQSRACTDRLSGA